MKSLKNNLCLILFLVISVRIFGQQIGKIENGFNVDRFPEISFIYHSHNPTILNEENFWHLKEAGIKREIKIRHLPISNLDTRHTTIILWEDMAHNGIGQYNFTQKVLIGFFEERETSSSDQFAISVFNRRKNEPSALKNLTNGFISDNQQIVDVIKNYRHSSEHYPEFPNRSDMYTAIRESLERLAMVKGTKSIIVFTSGYSMKNSGSDSEAQVLLKAQQLHIPVYIFQYYFKSGVAPESEGFAKSTWGLFNSYMDIPTAKSDLVELYPKMKERYKGHDYEVVFTSTAKRGEEARMISFSVDGVEIQEQFLPPSHTFLTWIKEYPIWFMLISAVSITLIVLLILFIRKTMQNTLVHEKNIEGLKEKQERDKKEIEQRQQQERVERERIEARAKQEEEAERLIHLMRTKNLYPRLKCSVGNDYFVYEINKPITFIGREQNNDLVFEEATVSRHHAEIRFNGTDFEIKDKDSTNKVILNGKFVECESLKSGDIIGLGEVVITFYL